MTARPENWWRVTNAAQRDALGTNNGVLVGALSALDDGTLHRCTVSAATTSTWVAAGGGGGAGSLSATLAIGNTAGANPIVMTAAQPLRGVDPGAAGNGEALNIRAGNANTLGSGGALTIDGGQGAGANRSGGRIDIRGGDSDTGAGTGNGATVAIRSGQASGVGFTGGTLSLTGGAGLVDSLGGPVTLTGGASVGAGRNGANVTVEGGGASDGIGGTLNLFAGDSTGADRNGGALQVTCGSGGGGNSQGGDFTMSGRPGAGTGRGSDLTFTAGSAGTSNARGGDFVVSVPAGTGAGRGGIIELDVNGVGWVDLNGASTLQFRERATRIATPVTGRGFLWVRSDTPNVLVFTNDAGTDVVIS